MFGKKLLVFGFTMSMVFAFTAVDSACSDMMRSDGKLTPVIERSGEDFISFQMFGKSTVLNLQDVEKIIDEANKRLKTLTFGGEHKNDFNKFKSVIL